MLHRATSITSKFPEKMSATAPVEVGTRGTVGSLLKKEIEYFRRLELNPVANSIKAQIQTSETANEGNNSKSSFGFSMMGWRKRKRRSNNGVLVPGMCSMVEVADSHKMDQIPGFTYVNLRSDSKKFEV